MTKKEFLKNLENALTGLPYGEIKDVLLDYEDHFAAGLENGRSEEDLAKSLGDPKQISRQIKATSKIQKAEKNFSVANIMRAILATAGLGFINIVFLAGPFFGLVGTLAGLFGAAIGITSGGIVATVASFIFSLAPRMTEHYFGQVGNLPIAGIFIGIAMACLGLLFLIADVYLAKWFYILILRYLKFNAKIITGEKE